MTTGMESIKAIPPGLTLGAWFAGLSMNEWAAFAAAVYSALLIGEKLYRWGQAWRAKRRK